MHMQQNFYGDTGMKIGKHYILIIAFIGLPMLILITITTIIVIKNNYYDISCLAAYYSTHANINEFGTTCKL